MRLAVLFFYFLILFPRFGFSDFTEEFEEDRPQEPTPITNARDFQKVCVPVCKRVVLNNPRAGSETLDQFLNENCKKGYENQELFKSWQGRAVKAKQFSKHVTHTCGPDAVKKAIVDPIVMLINLFIQDTSFQSLPLEKMKCEASSRCRLALARFIVGFHHVDRNGEYLVSDAEVLQKTNHLSIEALYILSHQGKKNLEKNCNNLFRPIVEKNYTVYRQQGSYAIQKRIYDEITQADPYCPSLLKLQEPIDPATLAPIQE
ncbi:MAG: hypothetical protein AAF203_09460, partial [Pseudomonadota bacterium]